MLGLALDEPDENTSVYTSNGINVYMHQGLAEQLEPMGGVMIDFVDNGPSQRGFMVRTKRRPDGAPDCSSGCESGCGE